MMTTLGCAVSPVVGSQSAITTPAPLVRYQTSLTSTSASFPALKVTALGSQFHGRRDSLGAALSSSVAFDHGLIERRRESHVSKVGNPFSQLRLQMRGIGVRIS